MVLFWALKDTIYEMCSEQYLAYNKLLVNVNF